MAGENRTNSKWLTSFTADAVLIKAGHNSDTSGFENTKMARNKNGR